MLTSETAIDMTKDGWVINEEYEKLFGSAKRINLFDTEEEYDELRQFIVGQPPITYSPDILPFDGIEIVVEEKQTKPNEEITKETDIKEELSRLIKSLLDYSNCKITKIVLSLSNDRINQTVPKKEKTPKKDIIPERVEPPKKEQNTQNNVKVPKLRRAPRYYYISRDMGNRSCNAKGMYDKINDKFIIMEGSILASEVTSSYRYTASDIKRKKFIQLNCKDKYNNMLMRDAICNSPDDAACFVLGENANGWTEWKSKEGISLECYINKV